jgi:hypothetical protein
VNSSSTDMALHRRNVDRLIQQGKSPAEIASYLDSVGVPKKRPVVIQPSAQMSSATAAPAKTGIGQKLDAFALSAFQSLTFGFGDEAIGTLRGLVTDKTTSQGIEEYRAQLAAAKAASPGMATAGSLVGAAVPALATGGIGAGAGMLGRIGAGAAVGAGAGAAQAAGDATGGVGARLQSGILPGMVGGALGGGMPLVGSAVGSTLKAVASKAPIFAKIPGVKSAEQQGFALVQRAIDRDGKSIDDLIDAARLKAIRGEPATLADIAGENTRGLMASASNVPGKAKQVLTEGLTERQAGQGGRLIGAAQQNMKLGLQNVVALKDQLLAQRSQDALPLYQAAFAKSVDVDGVMQQALDNPEFVKAYNLGRQLAAIEDVDLPPLFTVADDGSKIWTPQVPVQALDYMKRGLNKRIEAGLRSKAGVDRTAGYHLRNRLEGILQTVDKQVPEYGMARAFYKGESEAIEALEIGQKFRTMTPDAVAATYGPMSTVEKEMARTGYLESISAGMGKNKAEAPNVVKTIFGAPNDKKTVQVLFGDKADDMLDAIETEKTFSKTMAKVGGSRTEVLRHEGEDMAQLGGAAAWALVSRPGLAFHALAQSAGGRARTGWTEAVSDELAKTFSAGLSNPWDLHTRLLLIKAGQRAPKGIGPLPSLIGQGAGSLQQ